MGILVTFKKIKTNEKTFIVKPIVGGMQMNKIFYVRKEDYVESIELLPGMKIVGTPMIDKDGNICKTLSGVDLEWLSCTF